MFLSGIILVVTEWGDWDDSLIWLCVVCLVGIVLLTYVGQQIIIPVNKKIRGGEFDGPAGLTPLLMRWMQLNNIRFVASTITWAAIVWYIVAKGDLLGGAGMTPVERLVADPLRGVVAVISAADGAVRPRSSSSLPGVVLDLLGAESTPTTRHLFAIVGMFMAVVGGVTLQALLTEPTPAYVVLWCAVQKLGAFIAVTVGVTRDLFDTVAMAVALFDLLTARARRCPVVAAAQPRHGSSGSGCRHEAVPGAGRRRDARRLADRRRAGADRARPGVPARRRHLRRHHDDRDAAVRAAAGRDGPAVVGPRRAGLQLAAAGARLPARAVGAARPRRRGRRGAQGVPAPRHRLRGDPVVHGRGHVQRRRLRDQDLRRGAAHRRGRRAARRGHVAAAGDAAAAPGRPGVDRRGVGQGRERHRGAAPRCRRGVAGVVHRQLAVLGGRAARAVRPHDRDECQRRAVRRARRRPRGRPVVPAARRAAGAPAAAGQRALRRPDQHRHPGGDGATATRGDYLDQAESRRRRRRTPPAPR